MASKNPRRRSLRPTAASEARGEKCLVLTVMVPLVKVCERTLAEGRRSVTDDDKGQFIPAKGRSVLRGE